MTRKYLNSRKIAKWWFHDRSVYTQPHRLCSGWSLVKMEKSDLLFLDKKVTIFFLSLFRFMLASHWEVCYVLCSFFLFLPKWIKFVSLRMTGKLKESERYTDNGISLTFRSTVKIFTLLYKNEFVSSICELCKREKFFSEVLSHIRLNCIQPLSSRFQSSVVIYSLRIQEHIISDVLTKTGQNWC